MDFIGQTFENAHGIWRVVEASRTSDGFVLGTAVLLDDTGEEAQDESGFPIIHSVFLG